ncbi:MAG: hypothetical protein BA864_11085 [Desulfuromonadales bacterium C00003093]|nr:MAG: hypothetical protein BA864_11085 [Desulfuromonadales bacterium C00003093]
MGQMKMFHISQKLNSIDLSFSATLENIDKAAKETKSFLRKIGIENQDFNIILCLREALTNSVIHGCGKNCQKTVTCNLRIEGDYLIMEVEDNGRGFDWRAWSYKDPLPMNDSGRGLAIMKNYFSIIRYNEKGNRLILIKELNRQPS